MNKYIIEIFSPVVLILSFVLLNGATVTSAQNVKSIVNTSHLDYLYKKINVNGKDMGIIHIYADYPDYKYVEAGGEGIACVDDAARAEVFYIKYYKMKKNPEILDKIKNLNRFLTYMQAANGFFYNFIWKDYTIDSTYRTSVAEPNWWSWRAVWALAEAEKFFTKEDPGFISEFKPNLDKAIKVTHQWLAENYSNKKDNFKGIEIPAWLPGNYAADQSAIMVKAFTVYYETNKNKEIKNDIVKLCEGIIGMQLYSGHANNESNGQKKMPPYSVFLSWQNTWHEWGNSQADALLGAGRILKNKKYITHALKEIEEFYPYLMKENFLNDFTVIRNGNILEMKDVNKFPQIAYGIRPMVFASLKAYQITRNKKYAVTAAKLAGWFFGKNPANANMYNPKTGVCFDGILNEKEINKNSGAESTIEALLSLVEIEQNAVARKNLLEQCIQKKNNVN